MPILTQNNLKSQNYPEGDLNWSERVKTSQNDPNQAKETIPQGNLN